MALIFCRSAYDTMYVYSISIYGNYMVIRDCLRLIGRKQTFSRKKTALTGLIQLRKV